MFPSFDPLYLLSYSDTCIKRTLAVRALVLCLASLAGWGDMAIAAPGLSSLWAVCLSPTRRRPECDSFVGYSTDYHRANVGQLGTMTMSALVFPRIQALAQDLVQMAFLNPAQVFPDSKVLYRPSYGGVCIDGIVDL